MLTVERELNLEKYEFIEKDSNADLQKSRLTMHRPFKARIQNVFSGFLKKTFKRKSIHDDNEWEGPRQQILFNIDRAEVSQSMIIPKHEEIKVENR